MNEWKCVQVGHHKKIAGVIEEHQMEGWRLHTYQARAPRVGATIKLLFSSQ